MDLDTIIYIIAVIVIFIVSLFGQNKKKRNMPAQSDTDDVTYSLNDFEKILHRKEQFRQELEKLENSTEYSEPVNQIDDTIDESDYIEEKKEVEEVKEVDRKAEKEPDNEEKEDGFDLNSAIIYSSILERKKFRH